MDTRTKRIIEGLHPNAQDWARAHLQAIENSNRLPKGYQVKIISGHRSYEEQDALYAQGRSKPGQIVTNARGGQSNHNFGIAWDLGIFDDQGRYLENSILYTDIGPAGEAIGLEWGGRWQTLQDVPHYQVRTGKTLAELRALKAQNKALPIPVYGGSATKPTGDKVTVFDGPEITNIAAYNEYGRVWVATRPFVDRFGGLILSAYGNNFVIELHDQKVSVPGVIRDGVGYTKFADLNRILDWAYEYNANRLIIKTEKENK